MTDVGIFAPKFPPQTGGAAVYFEQVARVLGETEYTPHVLTTVAADGGEFVHPIFPGGLIHGAAFVPRCWRVLRQLDFDLLHVHPHFPQWRFYRWLAKALNRPLIYDCRDRIFTPRHVANGDHYLSAAGHIDALLADHGISRDSITRAPVVMPDVDPVSPIEVAQDEPMVAFVGDLTDAKGLPLAVSAVADMDCPTLHVAGGGRYAGALEACEARWLRYWGELGHQRTMGLIRDADALVLPSASEGRPRVVLEALSVGTPVVATDVGDVASMVDGAGVVVDRNTEAVADGIRAVLDDGRYAETAQQQTVGGDEAALRRALESAYAAALAE